MTSARPLTDLYMTSVLPLSTFMGSLSGLSLTSVWPLFENGVENEPLYIYRNMCTTIATSALHVIKQK